MVSAENESREGDGVSFTTVEVIQGSSEWLSARAGLLTGSRASDILAVPKVVGKGMREDYKIDLACERLTGRPISSDYQNADMQRGTALEPVAFAAYEAVTGRLASVTGFLRHDQYAAGVSLDGHVGAFERLLEVKCPKSNTHLRWTNAGVLPSEHLAQVTHSLWVTGAPCLDFMSFDDRFPEAWQTFIVTVHAKDIDLEAYQAKAIAFLAEVDALTETLRKGRAR